jgi:hypothetical protein
VAKVIGTYEYCARAHRLVFQPLSKECWSQQHVFFTPAVPFLLTTLFGVTRPALGLEELERVTLTISIATEGRAVAEHALSEVADVRATSHIGRRLKRVEEAFARLATVQTPTPEIKAFLALGGYCREQSTEKPLMLTPGQTIKFSLTVEEELSTNLLVALRLKGVEKREVTLDKVPESPLAGIDAATVLDDDVSGMF